MKNSTPDEQGTVTATQFAQVPTWVFEADISALAVRVYACLQRYAGEDGRAFPGRKALAKRSRCSVNSVDRAISELVDLGALSKQRRVRDDGSHTSNDYFIAFDNPSWGGVAPKTTLGSPKNDTRGSPKNDPPLRRVSNEGETDKDIKPPTPLKGDVEVVENFEAVRLANLLADLIAEDGSKRPMITPRWITTIEKMIRLDERSPNEIERAIRWCQQDDFWRANIMSPQKLRSKYDQMKKQAARTGQSGPTTLEKNLKVLREVSERQQNGTI